MMILTLLRADLEGGPTARDRACHRGRKKAEVCSVEEQGAAAGLSRGGRCGPPGRELGSHWVTVCVRPAGQMSASF